MVSKFVQLYNGMQTQVATGYFDIETNVKNKVKPRVTWKAPRELVCLPSVRAHLLVSDAGF